MGTGAVLHRVGSAIARASSWRPAARPGHGSKINPRRNLVLREMCLLLSGSILVTALAAGSSASKTTRKSEIERGSYLVNGVAGCGDCHTPFAANGAPDKAHWLQGATLSFGPLQPIP